MSDKIKVKVLRTFRNKYSKSLHKVGDLLEISEKRMEEINCAGYGQLVKIIVEPQSKPEQEIEPQQQEEEKKPKEAGE